MLPGGHILYVRYDQQIHRFRAWASNISDPQNRRALMETDSRVLYAPPMPGRHESHLLYIRRGSLVAQAVDATALRLIGQPFPIAENVFWFGPAATAAVSVSGNGVLVYRCNAQKLDPTLRSLLRETIFVMQAAQYGSLHHTVSERQPASVLGGRDIVRDGLRQTRA